MDDYDEDLTENEFFIEFKKRCPTVYATLPEKKWILCVPKLGSFDPRYFSDISFFSHVIVPLERDDEGEGAALLKTLRNQHLHIEKKVIRTGRGFRRSKRVPILFDETFFEAGQEHVLYCIAEPLEKAYSPDDDVALVDGELRLEDGEEFEEEEEEDDGGQSLAEGHVVALNTVDDCKLLLWGHSDNVALQTQMNAHIDAFCRIYQPIPETGRLGSDFDLKTCLSALKGLNERCFLLANKDPFLSQVLHSNPSLHDSIALATETYCLHSVFPVLWPLLADRHAREDANLNRHVRRLSRAFSHSIGVPRDFIDRIPRARREFAQIERATTPRVKNLCLRRVTRHLAQVTGPAAGGGGPGAGDASPEGRSGPRRQSVLTGGELLPIFVFLIVKSHVRNWHAQLTYMRQFRLSSGSDAADEFSYYCATLEAAMEHICSSLGADGEVERVDPAGLRCVRSESNPTPRSVEAFLQLVDVGDVSSVSSILSRTSPDTSAIALRQCHPLCRCADCEKASAERSRLIGVHCYNEQGRTALHIACIRGHTNLVDLLIVRGASVNVVDGQGWTGLHLACLYGHQDVVLLLLDAKADINAPDNEGNAPLHLSAERDFKDCVKALVYHGSNKSVLNIDAVNMAGDTALHLSARYGYEELCDLLLDCYASILVKNRKGQRPPECALSPSLRQRMLLRLSIPAAMTADGASQADTPSSNMVESGIELAPSSAATNTTTTTSIRTPTVSSSMVGSTAPGMSVTGFASRSTSRSSGFVDGPGFGNLHGSVVGQQPNDNTNAEVSSAMRRVEKMLKAAGDGDLPMVRHYLGLQEDDENEELQPNGVNNEAALCHPLCQCEKCLPIQKRTLSDTTSEVHVNSANSDGFTCLHVASIHGHLALAHFLLRRGADPGRRTRNLRLCALHQATQYGWPEIVSLLVQFGADLNAQDTVGNTPLYYAGSYGREVCAQRLLEAGAKPQIANSRGNTALHEAARAGHAGVVRVLLSHGAKPQARNKQHLTPLQFSASQEVRDLLHRSARSAPASGATSPHAADALIARSASASGAKRRPPMTGPAWSSERRVGLQPPSSLSLFDDANDDDELEVAEEVFAHRALFEDEESPGSPSPAHPSASAVTPQPPDWTSESESSPYRSAVVDSLTSTTPENAYRLDFNSLENSPENRDGRRAAAEALAAE